MSGLHKLVVELRHRRVFRSAGLYVVGSWVLLQVAELAFQSLGIPDSALIWVWAAAFLGFPLMLVLAWRYDFTASGIRRTSPADGDENIDLTLRSSDYLILAALAVVTVTAGLGLITEIREVAPQQIDSATSTAIAQNSIAVLPLDNLSGDPEQEYFVAGMHEAVTADLARISGIKVISRTSTEQYRDTDKSLTEIGSELGVANLIEGSVYRDADRVRITVQLIDAQTDEHIWAESYERELTNVLRLMSSVARAIAEQIKVKLTPDEDTLLKSRAQVDPEAYQLYLKGKFHWYKFTDADLKLALEYFERAIDKDPDYALAYVGFADAIATPAHIGLMPTTQVFPAAKRSVQRALELDPELAEAHDLRARIDFAYDWDWDAAERGFRRAISLKPGHPDAHIVYSQFLAITRRPDESLAEVNTGLELDPLNPWFRLELAQRLAWFDRRDEAVELVRELIESQPDFVPAYKTLWNIAYHQGQFEEAVIAASNYFRLGGETAVAEVLENRTDESSYSELMGRAADALETKSKRPYVSHSKHAELRMHAGDLDAALARLEEAHAQHESHLVYTIADPLYRPVWNDERYKEILRKMNYR
jgi:TolB-like protein/Tfp pilus assembly protein PilF